MTIRSLPAAPVASSRPNVSCEITPRAFQAWNRSLQASSDNAESISIFDPIGYDPWTGEGVTSKRIAAALRSLGGADVEVNINSPGGNVFEGLAIYNLLREYSGKVTTKVFGVAASAASFIAMAGDEILIARGAFFMIHNSMVVTAGNRHELRETADWLEPFDTTMADIYQARTGGDLAEIQQLMDAETWFGGVDAVTRGFADGLLAADAVREGEDPNPSAHAAQRLDVLMARQGVPRSERRKLIQEIKASTPSATGSGTRDAADPLAVSADLIAGLKSAFSRLDGITT